MPGSPTGASPTATTSIGTRWASSTSAAASSRGAAEACRGGRPVGRWKSQPRSSRSWRAGELRHRARVVGALLDEGQRLKDRVVDVGGHHGPFLRADALGALGGEVPPESPPEGREHERQGDDRDQNRHDRVAGRVEGAGPRKDDQRGADDEGDAEAAAVDVSKAIALGVAGGGRGFGLRGEDLGGGGRHKTSGALGRAPRRRRSR